MSRMKMSEMVGALLPILLAMILWMLSAVGHLKKAG